MIIEADKSGRRSRTPVDLHHPRQADSLPRPSVPTVSLCWQSRRFLLPPPPPPPTSTHTSRLLPIPIFPSLLSLLSNCLSILGQLEAPFASLAMTMMRQKRKEMWIPDTRSSHQTLSPPWPHSPAWTLTLSCQSHTRPVKKVNKISEIL